MSNQDNPATPAATGEEIPTPAWKERAKQELKELQIKRIKLEDALNADPGFVDREQIFFLKQQLAAMTAYEAVLEYRIF